MKRIGLIDVDGGKTYPNLALMKILRGMDFSESIL